MLSLRSFSRICLHARPSPSTQSTLRSLSSFRRPLIHQPNLKAVPTPRYAPFSSTRISWEKEGQVDQELSAKIESELQLEKESRDSDKTPSTISDYIDSSPFELHDTLGQEEVVLTRKFGDESIRVSFSIADLNAMDQDPDDFSDDKALYDEETDDMPVNTQTGGANTKGSVNQGRTKGGNFSVAPEDEIAPTDLVDQPMDDSNAEASFPARINVMIEKPGKGTLQIETTAQDGEVVIDNVYYFRNAELADAETAELDWKRRHLYEGPPFGNLDEELQMLLERYLDERGINAALAMWVPEYIDFKEQREYLGWLTNVKDFVDA